MVQEIETDISIDWNR